MNEGNSERVGPMLNPPHLGELIRESMDETGWNVTETATRLGCERGTLSRLLNGRAGVSAAMALALESIGWGTAEHWMRCRRVTSWPRSDGSRQGRQRSHSRHSWALPDAARRELCFSSWRPLPAPVLADADPWLVLRRRDVLLHHPFETFDHILGLLQAAAGDDAVLAIKMTLYRTSGDSPVVHALERAAANGKQVTALVEIKARFDEQQNIDWAARLERAGAIVVYGIAGLKVHAKALLIVRREEGGVRTYTHLGTGNYNDTTARLYTDIGLLTARDAIGREATLFFNAVTGYSSAPRFQHLAMAPAALKRTLLAHIQREAAVADSGGLIMAKMNSLSDPDVIAALYAASQAGVTVLLNVRGVCLLRPQVPGLSDSIRVVSVVGRFLEHSRIAYFRNGGAEQVYLASADWMPRNLERRVELMFPVEQPDLRRRLVRILELYFADNCHSYELQPDGRYRKRRPPTPESGKRRVEIHAQERLQQQAWSAERRRVRPDDHEFTVRRRPPG